MEVMLTECITEYLHNDIRLFNFNELSQSGAKSLKGGMGGNFKISCCRGQMLLIACDRMKLTDPNRKLCR